MFYEAGACAAEYLMAHVEGYLQHLKHRTASAGNTVSQSNVQPGLSPQAVHGSLNDHPIGPVIRLVLCFI